MQTLVEAYDTDRNIKNLLDETRIHMLPSQKPDGYERSHEGDCNSHDGRFNARNIDSNRNFADQYVDHSQPTQPETQAMDTASLTVQLGTHCTVVCSTLTIYTAIVLKSLLN